MRKFQIAIAMLAGLFLVASPSYAAKPIKDDSMGLSKTSVFDTPEQQAYQYNPDGPGQSKPLPRAYLNAPPQVPHDISGFLPITAQGNMCIACHDQPGQWGQKPQAGVATPIPQSHYTDQRNAPGKVGDHLVGARYNCNQCHVPQTDAKPLVNNSFPNGHKR